MYVAYIYKVLLETGDNMTDLCRNACFQRSAKEYQSPVFLINASIIIFCIADRVTIFFRLIFYGMAAGNKIIFFERMLQIEV